MLTPFQTGLHLRAVRLANGPFRVDDATHLYLALPGPEQKISGVVEIGDFIAHPDERIRGVVADQVVADVMRMGYRLEQQVNGHEITHDDLTRLCWASIKVLSDAELVAATGMTVGQIEGVRGRLRAVHKANGAPTRSDWEFMVKVASAKYVVKPPFTADSVLEDLISAVRTAGLAKDVAEGLRAHKTSLALFVASMMHGCQITSREENDAYSLALSEVNGLLRIGAGFFFVRKSDGAKSLIIMPYFDLGLSPAEHATECVLEMLKKEPAARNLPLEYDATRNVLDQVASAFGTVA